MNYIGSKLSLMDFLKEEIMATLKSEGDLRTFEELVFADGFAGTGIVGTEFKKMGFSVISNDIQYYSYVMTRHFIENSEELFKNWVQNPFELLNNIEPVEGFIYYNYSLGGTKGSEFERMYFTDENAKKCDAIRMEIEKWKNEKRITNDEYFYLLASLINSIDKVANTASVYGAFLKNYKKSALQPLILQPLEIVLSSKHNKSYNLPIEDWIRQVEGDILYLDPPYNERQYCSNYHMLETIAKYDNPIVKGKTGLRDYKEQKSDWCSKSKVCNVFEELISNAKFKYIFLSYNNEGLMSLEDVERIMTKYGTYRLATKKYRRFKADNERFNKADSTFEYLHCLIKID